MLPIESSDACIYIICDILLPLKIYSCADIMVGFSSPIYTTNGGAGYVQVCAEILKGTLEKSVSVHLTSTNDTAIIGW